MPCAKEQSGERKWKGGPQATHQVFCPGPSSDVDSHTHRPEKEQGKWQYLPGHPRSPNTRILQKQNILALCP